MSLEMILGLAGLVRDRVDLPANIVMVLVEWLCRYGYLADPDPSDHIGATKRFIAALSRAAEFHDIDAESPQAAAELLLRFRFLERPRCGHGDLAQAVKSNPWTAAGISTVRIGFANYLPSGLSRADQRDLTDLAAKSWTEVCALKAELVADGQAAHVVIACMAQNESDGPGGTLMYTYLPTGRQTPLFVDTRDRWGTDLPYRNSMAHEFGHILCGLTHSSPNDAKRSLMDPYLDKGVAVPQPEDIARAVAFWGPKEEAPAPVPPAPPALPPSLPADETVIRVRGGKVSIDGYRLTKVDAREEIPGAGRLIRLDAREGSVE